MSSDVVALEVNGAIAHVTINRPKQLNALNREVLSSLLETFSSLSSRTDLRLITVRGVGGKAFVAGADIEQMQACSPQELQDFVQLGQNVMKSIEASPVPVVALVEGFALGGGMELALACDLIIASSRSKLGQPEVKLGIIPGFGGTQRLLYRAGIGTARRLVYTGDMIAADEAKSLGLVDYVFDADEFDAQVTSWQEELLSRAPLAVRESKQLLNGVIAETLGKGLAAEVEAFHRLFVTEDRAEGMKAFSEKRAPEFKSS